MNSVINTSGAAQQRLLHNAGNLALRPYDLIRDTPLEVSRECAAQALSGGKYAIKGMEFSVDQPIDWEAKDHSRSYRMYIQAWNFLEPFFIHYNENRDKESLEILFRHVDSWIEQFGAASSMEEDIAEVTGNLNSEGLFVGHSMAIAGRFYRLAFLLDVASRQEDTDRTRFSRLLDALKWHAFYLAIESRFLHQHNHGLQVALSQTIGASRLLEMSSNMQLIDEGHTFENAYTQGKRRLFQTLTGHVCSDGCHREHSPHYHLVVANAIREPIENGVIRDGIIVGMLEKMTKMAAWLFDFNGRLANMGDSDLDLLPAGAEHFRGKTWPTKPKEKLFKEGGYWFVKGSTKAGKNYLVQQSAMFSRTHKHPDSGTMIWMDHGRDILVDAGRYGYVGRTKIGSDLFNDGFWYSDPRRVYVESTKAHNTIQIDRKNHPRFRAKPFASGMRASNKKDGVFACESTIANLPGASHFRILATRPGAWMLCIDTLRMSDGKDHEFRQNFHLHPDWALETKGKADSIFRSPDDTRLHVTPVFSDAKIVDLARGRGNPEKDEDSDLFGWWSPRHAYIEPCNSLAVETTGAHVTMATLFTFGSAEIDKSFTVFNVTRRRLRFRWTSEGKTESLVIDRSGGDQDKPVLALK